MERKNRAQVKNEIRDKLDRIFDSSAWGQRFATVKDDETGKVIEGREILLPLSPSDDARLMPSKHGGLCNTFPYRAWLSRAERALKRHLLAPYTKDVPLYVYTVVVMPNRRSDHHNYQKALYDSFQNSGCVLENDRQIVERHTVGMVIKDRAFTLSYVFPDYERELLRRFDVPETTIDNAIRIIDENGTEQISLTADVD